MRLQREFLTLQYKITHMEIMAIFFSICAVIVGAFWAFTETPKGKKWIKNL